MATNGLVVMTPTSIAYSGTSASINADGSVSFSAVTSLSLNGVFTGDYDNYAVTSWATSGENSASTVRLRTGGTDDSSSSYTRQLILVNGTALTAQRTATTFWYWGAVASTLVAGQTTYVFGPYLAQPTAFRTVEAGNFSSARIYETAGTHSQSVSYDGFTFYPSFATDYTGRITVFGFNQ